MAKAVPVYKDAKIGELARQLTYTPAARLAYQLEAAHELVLQLDARQSYPWDFVLFRLTGYRPVGATNYSVAGAVLRADLATLVAALAPRVGMRVADVAEPVLRLDEVTSRFQVCTKTIRRWRRRGLVYQQYIFPDGRRRMGFRQSAVEHFALAESQRVRRSSGFRQLSGPEKQWIVRRARRLAARCNCGMKDISLRLGRRLNRSPECIRLVIRRHDRAFPQAAVFPLHVGPLGAPQRQAIVESFDRGMPVAEIARTYRRTRSSIYRVVGHEKRLRAQAMRITFVHNPLFDLPEAESIILTELPREATRIAAVGAADKPDPLLDRSPRDIPPFLAHAFQVPPLHREIEMDLFRRMNYLKFSAAAVQRRLALGEADGDVAEMHSRLAAAEAIKTQLVQANLRVVVHVSRKHMRPGADLMELISDGNVWLLRAVETFDFSRGVKFATYASLVLMKNFARRPEEQLHRPDARLVTGQDDLLNALYATDGEHVGEQLDRAAMHKRLRAAIDELPPRERVLLTAHFGLDAAQQTLSLAQLGERMGVTKARVRQIETRALRRLRRTLEEGDPAWRLPAGHSN